MSRIKQISPCDGWVFVATSEHKGDILRRVAAWALLEDGSVVGLISERSDGSSNDHACLVLPDMPGSYYKESELTNWQRLVIDDQNAPPHESWMANV